MATITPQCFNNIAQYLNTSVGKITKKNNLYTCVNSDQSVTGIINIIFLFLKESKSSLGPKNVLDEALILQWLEYAIVYAGNANNHQNIQILLKELNTILSTKTFLVDNRLTIADIFLYYVLVNVMELNTILSTKTFLVDNRLTIADIFLYYVLVNVMTGLSNFNKEKFLNVSRWFDNIQQDSALRQKNSLVDFSTNYLAIMVPSRH